MIESGGKNMKLCPFCKTPPAESDEENVERVKKLMEKDNANAFYQLAGFYDRGMGMPQNRAKANEFYLEAGQLGCALAYFNLELCYDNVNGTEVDKKKAKHYY